MRIIDATWEKRNLNCSCVEIHIDDTDTEEEIHSSLTGIKADYQVLTIATCMPDVLNMIQEHGFRFIETKVNLSMKLNNTNGIPKPYTRFEPYIRIEPATHQEEDMVIQRVRSDRIFRTDRIALDARFGIDTAGQRYANWIRDALDQGALMTIIWYKDAGIGFEINRMLDSGISDGLLGGLFTQKENGMGFSVMYANIETGRMQGANKVQSCVSSNNMPILKLHQSYGFKIDTMSYVLTRHMDV